MQPAHPPIDRPRHRLCRACGFDRAGIAADMPCPECGRSIEQAEAMRLRRLGQIARGARLARWMLNLFLVFIVLRIAALHAFQYWPWLASGSLTVDVVVRTIGLVSGISVALLAVPGVYLLTVPPPVELGRAWAMHTARWALFGALALGVTARVAAPNDATLGGLLGALSALLAAGGVLMLFRAGELLTRELGVPVSRFRMTVFGGLIQLGAVVLFATVAFELIQVAAGRASMPMLRDHAGLAGFVFVLGIGNTAHMMLKMFKEAEASGSRFSPSSAR